MAKDKKNEIKTNIDPTKTNIEFDTNKMFQETALFLMNLLKKSSSVVPTFAPTEFKDQIYFYKNGSDYRIYFYIDNSWKYTNLT